MSKLLRESSAIPLAQSGNLWRAVCITPGEGSSGTYSESMLKAFGATAFPKGTHSYVDHPSKSEPERSPKNLIGVLSEDAHYEEGVGVVANIEILPHWKDFVEAVAPHTGLSIYAMGTSDDDGTVTALESAIDNSVDLVSYAGRGGALAEKLYESAVSHSTKGTAATEQPQPTINRKDESMDKEEMKAMLAEFKTELVGALSEALKPVEIPEGETDFAAVAESAVKAGLPEESRKVVYESVKNGATAEDAIASQKALVDAISKQVQESAKVAAAGIGRVVEGGGQAGFSMSENLGGIAKAGV